MNDEEISGSSPELEQDAGNQVEESSSTPGETEDSLLSVVQNVSQADTQESADSESESPTENQSEIVDEEPEAAKADDFSDVPFNKHPRFKELIKEKNAYKAQIAEYEPDAKQYRQIQTFMESNQLTPEEVAEGLVLMAQMKSGDPAKAYEALSEKLENLALQAGKKLPKELEDRVEQGYIDRETAQTLYVQQVNAEREAAKANLQLQQRTQQDSQTQAAVMANTVAAWESATRASDPDFEVKAELVKDRVRAHIAQHGMPKSAEAALALSKEAYEAVTKTLRRVQGVKPAMRTAVGGKVNGSAAPEPRNLLDVIRQASAGS